MTTLFASLPLHLVCQLIVPGIKRFDQTNDIGATIDQSSVQTELPNGYVSCPDIGVAYKTQHDVVTWKQARKLCLLEGAQLALIDSFKKLECLKRQRDSPKKYTNVGIHNMFDKNEWVSVKNGSSLSSLPWASGEPSNDFNCVMVNWETNGLSNGGCTILVADYACEIPIPVR